MLSSSDLVGFVPSTDLDRARQFYEGVLGLRVLDANPFALVIDAHGTQVRVTQVPDLQPQPFTVLGWHVADIEAAVDDLVARGATFTIYDGMPQDDRGIWTTPGGEKVAWFKDPDGNTLSISWHA